MKRTAFVLILFALGAILLPSKAQGSEAGEGPGVSVKPVSEHSPQVVCTVQALKPTEPTDSSIRGYGQSSCTGSTLQYLSVKITKNGVQVGTTVTAVCTNCQGLSKAKTVTQQGGGCYRTVAWLDYGPQGQSHSGPVTSAALCIAGPERPLVPEAVCTVKVNPPTAASGNRVHAVASTECTGNTTQYLFVWVTVDNIRLGPESLASCMSCMGIVKSIYRNRVQGCHVYRTVAEVDYNEGHSGPNTSAGRTICGA